jgi:uncharacterized protein YqiB (DUF1249 family)
MRSAAVRTPPGSVHWTQASPLQAHHAGCEENYLRLARLLPGFAAGTTRRIGIRFPGGHHDALELAVQERSAWTAEILLRQLHPVWGTAALELRIRAYLDARMAEVTGCAQARRMQVRYVYPNRRGFLPDERWQMDRLLAEWLARCLAEGHALHEPVPACGT